MEKGKELNSFYSITVVLIPKVKASYMINGYATLKHSAILIN